MSVQAKNSARPGEPVKIKKYANRRLYNTETSAYVTLEDLAAMVREEREFVVIDAKSQEDLTHSVLTQIILEQESKGQSLLPINFLRQLICFYGDSMEKLVPTYLDLSLASLTREQGRYRKQLSQTFAGTPMELPVEAMQKQAEQNIAVFEQALSMFTPFKPGPAKPREANAKPTPAPGNTSAKGRKQAPDPPSGGDQIGALQEQLAAIQRQLADLAKSNK